MKICAFCWETNSLAVVCYDSAFGIFEIGSFDPDKFSSILDNILQLYEITDFLIPSDANKAIVRKIKSKGINIIFRRKSDFSYSNGTEALNSMIFLVPEEDRDEIKKSIISGIVDISSKSVIGAISAIFNFMTKDDDDKPDFDSKNIEDSENIGIIDDEIIDLQEKVVDMHEKEEWLNGNNNEISNDGQKKNFFVSAFKSLEISHGLYLPKSAAEELQIITYDQHPSIHNSSMRAKDGLSLFSLFNRTSTLMGKNQLKMWFLRTLENPDQINSRLDIIETFVSNEMRPVVNEIINHLHTMPEICHLLIFLQKESMTPSRWQRLYKGLFQASKLCQFIESLSHPLFESNPQYFGILNSETASKLFNAASEIDTTIEIKSNSIYVRDEFDSHLKQMREKYSKLDSLLTEIASKLMQQLPPHCAISELSVVYVPLQGFLVTILKGPSMIPQDLPSGYSIHFQTNTHFYCKNEAMQDLDDKLGDIYTRIQAREIQIIVSLSDKIITIGSLINKVWESIGILDAFCSLSIVAAECRFVRPIVTNSKDLVIVNGRHPLLEKCSQYIVPNSTENKVDECPIHIITGPNSSGKSIYLKQVAIIIYLAHIGSFVPADEAIIPFTDYMFCFFQTSNSITVQPFTSSFLNETKKVAEAMNKSTEKSIIILDEFGKTSNYLDGASLLCGIVRYLCKLGDKCPKTFISTHFHNILKTPFLEPQMFVPCVMNVKYVHNKENDEDDENEKDDETLVFLYQLIKGERGLKESSLGLHCAKLAGLPGDIVERAEVVAQCFEEGNPIPPNKYCINNDLDKKCREALSLFIKFNSIHGNPRALLQDIDQIIYSDI